MEKNGNVAVENHLVAAILVTVFCCLPLGIVAIINAAKVNGLVASGDVAGAQAASAEAAKWSKIAGITGVVIIILSIILNVGAGIMAGAAMQ